MPGASDAIQSLISKYVEKWAQAEKSPILKLNVLRSLARDLHTERSRSMAGSEVLTGMDIGVLERRLDLLRDVSPDLMHADLEQVLSIDPIPTTRIILRAHRPSLPDDFPPPVLVRLGQYDRKWELAIAEEAAARLWDFYRLEAWIEVSAIEGWSRELSEHLWPNGTVLFAESGGFSKDSKYWLGRWSVVTSPSCGSISGLTLPKSASGAPDQPQWRLLFSPSSS